MAAKLTGKTHDYTGRYWGHDYVIIKSVNQGEQLAMMGWGDGIENGDFIILQNEGDTTRYQVGKIKYFNDPRDMWSMSADFAPRSRPENLCA